MMSKKSKLAVIVAATLVAFGLDAAFVPQNSGFEEDDNKGQIANWSLYSNGKWRIVRGEGRNGTRALKCEDTAKGGWTIQWVDVAPNRAYRVTAWVRTEGVSGGGAKVDFSWNDADGNRIGVVATKGVTGTTGWTEVSAVAFVPPTAKRCLLGTPVTGCEGGQAWFDDIRVEPVELPPVALVTSSAYRHRAAAGKVKFSAALNMMPAEIAAKGLRGTFEMNDDAGARRVVPADIVAGEASTTVDARDLPLGTSKVTFALLDRSNHVVGKAAIDFTRTAKPETKGVRIDSRNITRIDGTPFFPLGMFIDTLSEAKINRFATGPFNCMMSYQEPTDAQLEQIHAKGLKIIYSLKDCYLGLPSAPTCVTNAASEVEYITRKVNQLKHHPAILAWYINDELGLDWMDSLTEHRDLFERLDPNHPTYVALYKMEELRGQLPSYDVIGTDPYPICQVGDPPISQVMEHTRITRRETFNRPMWQIPQAFDWGVYRKADYEKTRTPTEAEMRNMAWQFIAEGANGLVFYCYDSWHRNAKRVPEAEMWARMCRIGGEIKSQIEVFLSEEPAPECQNLTEMGCVRAWRKDGVIHLVAVNPTYKPQVIEFILEGERRSVSLMPLGVWFGKVAK